ncbi:hypothetical protein [Streptomyces anulatus]|uniref:hypothetical protein n=1 Tax=Streptomyces anulatus TaxID=1892 RepID=UPI001C2673A5|nr:hypothetical protein [Streptomyces anulatus]
MNPYDPNTEPGTHFVADTLGVSNVGMLNTTYRPSDPLYRASTRVIKAADELNERHDRVTVAAKDAFRLLESIERTELGRARVSYAFLRTSAPKLGELLTKQDRAYDQLVEAVSAYQRLLPDPDTGTRRRRPTRRTGNSVPAGTTTGRSRRIASSRLSK